jgi:hypothetical protein
MGLAGCRPGSTSLFPRRRCLRDRGVGAIDAAADRRVISSRSCQGHLRLLASPGERTTGEPKRNHHRLTWLSPGARPQLIVLMFMAKS